MIKGIHHVQITIPKEEEERAKAFYCQVLGLEELEKPTSLQGRGGFWLKVGTQEVHIGTEDGFNRYTTKAHLAYEVEDCKHWYKIIREQGIEIQESVPIPGYHRFEFRDSFGNRIEIIQVTSE